MLLLIESWSNLRSSFKSGKKKTQPLWQHIALVLTNAGLPTTWKQAKSKWRALTKGYREAINMEGELVDTESCPYYKELSEVYGFVRNVQPIVTSSTLKEDNSVTAKEKSCSSENQVLISDHRRKRSHAARPRSDATEPFATVKRIHKDLKSLEQERTQLMKDIHADRMEMMEKFITALENR